MPVYGDGSIFYVTSYSGGACYRLPSRETGSQPEKAWDTTLDTCTGAVLLVDGLLFWQRLPETQIVALPGLEVRSDSAMSSRA